MSPPNPITVPVEEIEHLIHLLEQARLRKDWDEVDSVLAWANHNLRARKHPRLRAVKGGGG